MSCPHSVAVHTVDAVSSGSPSSGEKGQVHQTWPHHPTDLNGVDSPTPGATARYCVHGIDCHTVWAAHTPSPLWIPDVDMIGMSGERGQVHQTWPHHPTDLNGVDSPTPGTTARYCVHGMYCHTVWEAHPPSPLCKPARRLVWVIPIKQWK